MKKKLPCTTDEIFNTLGNIGIKQEDVVSIYLFGSYYWGYAAEGSDLDLYVILKTHSDRTNVKAGNIHFVYINTEDECNEKIRQGSWSHYYVLNHTSRGIWGKKIKFVEYPRDKALLYLKEKEGDLEGILIDKAKWSILTLMARVFLADYFLFNIKTFKLTDFKKCPIFNKEEKKFINMVYVKLFKGEDITMEDRRRMVELCEKVEEYIRENI